jgi:hypothetical protein
VTWRRRFLAVALAGLLLPAGCTPAKESPPTFEPAWRKASLPTPAGAVGRLVLRDAAVCDGRWFVVGAVQDQAGGTVPAAWSSADGTAWATVRIAAKTYYGKQNVLSSVACRGGVMAALGAKVGGAHGNPRTSSWRQTPDGVLHEVTAPFELFGGPQAVNVVRLDAGPAGWLISGNRMSGAAAWVSPDAAVFRIVERAPGLASGAAGETWAFDGTAGADGWLMVGGVLPKGRIDRDPTGWRSADGVSWEQVPAAGASEAYEELQRVVAGAVPIAVGVRGATFGAWRLDAGRWQPAGAFGAVRPGGMSGARALAVVGGRLFCVTADGVSHTLWVSDDGGVRWRPGVLPVPVPAGLDRTVVVAGGEGRLLALTDDAANGRIYLAETAK